jgi:hypothetical protein
MRVRRPKSLLQLVTRDHFPLLLQQHNQHLIDLALQAKPRAIARDLLALLVDMKWTKAHVARLD